MFTTTHTSSVSVPSVPFVSLPTQNNALLGEAALLEKCKTGDAAAWDMLIRRYEKSVYKFAYSLCRNHEEAGDIAGQVFLRLYQNLHTFRNEASFHIVAVPHRAEYLPRSVRPTGPQKPPEPGRQPEQ